MNLFLAASVFGVQYFKELVAQLTDSMWVSKFHHHQLHQLPNCSKQMLCFQILGILNCPFPGWLVDLTNRVFLPNNQLFLGTLGPQDLICCDLFFFNRILALYSHVRMSRTLEGEGKDRTEEEGIT